MWGRCTEWLARLLAFSPRSRTSGSSPTTPCSWRYWRSSCPCGCLPVSCFPSSLSGSPGATPSAPPGTAHPLRSSSPWPHSCTPPEEGLGQRLWAVQLCYLRAALQHLQASFSSSVKHPPSRVVSSKWRCVGEITVPWALSQTLCMCAIGYHVRGGLCVFY